MAGHFEWASGPGRRLDNTPVDQPERTAHYDHATCIAEMVHNTRI